MTWMTILFRLLCGHAVADFALQTESMARNKSRQSGSAAWPWVLCAHALTHGLATYLATGGCIEAGIAETMAHGLIDTGKAEAQARWPQFSKYTIHIDQALHIVTKIVWLVLMTKGVWWV